MQYIFICLLVSQSDTNGKWVDGIKVTDISLPLKTNGVAKTLLFLSLLPSEETKHAPETKRVSSTAITCHIESDEWAFVWWPISSRSYVYFNVAPMKHDTWPLCSPASLVSANNFGSAKREWESTYCNGAEGWASTGPPCASPATAPCIAPW